MKEKIFAAALATALCTATQAGGNAAPATGLSLRDAALSAARQSVVPGDPTREPSGAALARGTSYPLSRTFMLGNTDVSLDFCSGAHLLMTSNPDSVIELVQHP